MSLILLINLLGFVLGLVWKMLGPLSVAGRGILSGSMNPGTSSSITAAAKRKRAQTSFGRLPGRELSHCEQAAVGKAATLGYEKAYDLFRAWLSSIGMRMPTTATDFEQCILGFA